VVPTRGLDRDTNVNGLDPFFARSGIRAADRFGGCPFSAANA
jgi:hypothetical protein